MSLEMLPLVAFDRIEDARADQLLKEWGHWLGGCNRPFGRHSFGLALADVGIISVAVSASTVGATCGGYPRNEVVELARCASMPGYQWASRVALRLWRETANRYWAADYWPVRAAVSYSNALRHKGDLYRFDGWTKVADVAGSVGGGSWSTQKQAEPKVVWVWRYAS